MKWVGGVEMQYIQDPYTQIGDTFSPGREV